ncbi:MAG: DUF4129 domain-containing protein [Ruminiclostridium sp.]|nr:DUF4129 domain-containing protein [Ruminiclostridium sp.]
MLLNEANEQEIRKTVEQILSRREFQHKEKNPIAQMINQIWESILEWVRGLFKNRQPQRQSRFNPNQFSQNVELILKIALIVLAAVVLFIVIRLVIKRIYLPGKMKKSKIPKAHEFLENPESALEKMKSLMDKGLFNEAMRYLFVAVLLELHDRKIIKIEKWKTNRIYMREITASSPQLVPPMRELSAVFNGCCYGNRNIDEECMNTWLQFYRNEKGKDEKTNQKVD